MCPRMALSSGRRRCSSCRQHGLPKGGHSRVGTNVGTPKCPSRSPPQPHRADAVRQPARRAQQQAEAQAAHELAQAGHVRGSQRSHAMQPTHKSMVWCVPPRHVAQLRTSGSGMARCADFASATTAQSSPMRQAQDGAHDVVSLSALSGQSNVRIDLLISPPPWPWRWRRTAGTTRCTRRD